MSRRLWSLCFAMMMSWPPGRAVAQTAEKPKSAETPARTAPPPTVGPTSANYVTPDYIRKPPSLPAHLQGRTPRQLSLREAIETSLRQNLALALDRERVREIDAAGGVAFGPFEPFLQGGVRRDFAKSPPATLQEGEAGQVVRSTFDSWSLGLAQRLPTGTELRIDWNNTRAENTAGTAVRPELFRSNLSLGLVQPLLRDFSFSTRIQRAPILRAEFASEAAREDARLRALLTVKSTEDAYWGLVESWKAYEVNAGARELAEKQLALTRRQIEAGVLPESDVIGVEGTLAQRQIAVVRAEAQIERAADLLRSLLSLPAAAWDSPILPVDAPSFAHVELAMATAVERAEKFRPELGRSRIDLRQIALDLDVARNARWPRLDLRGQVNALGQDERYGQSLDQVRDATGRGWSLGLTLGWAPLGVATRAELRRLESALRQKELGREQILLTMRAQIREALRSIETAERQLLASAKFRDLAERSLDVEQRRFLNGLSSNFIVAQRQAELAQARLAELEALIQHERASSDLQLATGQLLEARGLRFDVRPNAGG